MSYAAKRLMRNGGFDMMEATMTDRQFNKIIKMVRMIIDKCDTIDEAKERLAELDDDTDDKNDRKKTTED